MTITKSQRITISQLWNKVCKDRGWATGDRALRLATLGGILGRELTTMDDIGRLDECTKVMAELKAMLGVDLQAGKEAVDQGINRQRNSRWLIENEVLPCLALYVENGLAGARAFLLKIMVDKSRWRKTDRPECDPVLAEFDERTSQQILWTISARLNDKRKAAGDTGHDMRTKAGVNCDCARICQKKIRNKFAPPIPPLPVGTDEAETTAEMMEQSDGENPF
jgi:hypothetical protein